MNEKIVHILFISLMLITWGCSTQQPENDKLVNEVESTIDLEADFQKAKMVFYNLPAPHEAANLLLADSTLHFDSKLLNPTDNVNRYNTEKQMALALGVYSSDLSFATLYEQNQEMISYLAIVKKMADKLGIIDAVGQEYVERLSKQMSSRDDIIQTISEAFRKSDSQLKENNRSSSAVLMVTGGWFEGLYLAASLAEQNKQSTVMLEKILEQQLSVDILISLLSDYKDTPEIAELLAQANKLQILYTKATTTSDELKATGKVINLNHPDVLALFDYIKSVRSLIVSI